LRGWVKCKVFCMNDWLIYYEYFINGFSVRWTAVVICEYLLLKESTLE
jgi:hypothetical protein